MQHRDKNEIKTIKTCGVHVRESSMCTEGSPD